MIYAVLLMWGLFIGLPNAFAFTVPLVNTSHGSIGGMQYALVTGEVDALDDTTFHLMVEINPALQDEFQTEFQTDFGMTNRFGLVGFWFNTQRALDPQRVFLQGSTAWRVQLNNLNCPGGCSARGSGFGEFDHKIIWTGHPADRPERLQLDIFLDDPVIEADFLKSSAPRPGSDNTGQFAIYLDGFDLTIAGERIRGTFVKD